MHDGFDFYLGSFSIKSNLKLLKVALCNKAVRGVKPYTVNRGSYCVSKKNKKKNV